MIIRTYVLYMCVYDYTHLRTRVCVCMYVCRPSVDNIKMDLQELECGGMDWTELVQDRGRWWALVNAIMNLWVP
jgi:hypothetical protein